MKKILISGFIGFLMAMQAQASTPGEFINKGNSLWQQGKLTEAEDQFKQAIKTAPDSSAAHARLAGLYLTQNQSARAIDEYQHAIMNSPEDARLFIGIAIAYLHGQHFEMAQAMVAQALALNPQMTNAKKLKSYIDQRRELMATSAMPQDSRHGGSSIKNPHQSIKSVAPAAVRKSLSTPH